MHYRSCPDQIIVLNVIRTFVGVPLECYACAKTSRMKNPFSTSENNRRRTPEEESPEYPGSRSYLRSKRLKIIVGVFTFIVIIVVISQSVTIIQAGHRGVVLFVGAVENRLLGEGVHFVIPFAEQVIPLEVASTR